MEHMAETLRGIVAVERPRVQARRLDIFYLREPDGCPHRVVICNWADLKTDTTLAVVGFFGQRRPDADELRTHMADSVLLQEFVEHPDLLSYSSLQLPSGQWGNLVLFRRPEGLQHWSRSRFHAQAAQEISPHYYFSIRLHNGVLVGGLFGGQPIRLVRTKYYDYAGPPLPGRPFWQAVRMYSSE